MGDLSALGRIVMLLGVVVTACGFLIWRFPGVFGLIGKLPGDISIHGDRFSVFVPISSSILISALLSLAVFAVSRLVK